jgi:hypothetical protein
MTPHQPITGAELEKMKRLAQRYAANMEKAEIDPAGDFPQVVAEIASWAYPRCLSEIEADKTILRDVFAALTTGRFFVSGDCGDEMLLLIDRVRKSLSAP